MERYDNGKRVCSCNRETERGETAGRKNCIAQTRRFRRIRHSVAQERTSRYLEEVYIMTKREVHSEAMNAVRNICYFQSVLNVADEVMASKMGISRATWANRKAKPLMLTLGEVIRAADYFKGHGIDINSAQLMTVLVGADVGTEVA